MTRYMSKQLERDSVMMVAQLMAASARTAPKARGVDATKSLLIDGEDLEQLAAAMERKAASKPPHASPIFRRDANNVRDSNCVLLIGVTGEPKKIEQPLDCGACGYGICKNLAKARKQTKNASRPNCIFQAIDLGIALGSAVKLASELGVDNRMMYTVGSVAKEVGLLNSDVVIGIPLSVSGKSPYFDRP